MDRKATMLASLACAPEHHFSPVQVQKLFFLIDMKLGSDLGGPFFDFKPYDYGPFDSSVYSTLEELSNDNLIAIKNHSRPRTYVLTEWGRLAGQAYLNGLDERTERNLRKLVEFVKSLSFPQLVSAIYKEYPEMREKSVFRG